MLGSFYRSKQRLKYLLCIWLCLYLSACTNTYKAPVSSRNQQSTIKQTKTSVSKDSALKTSAGKRDLQRGYYIVRGGDTLYSIAWRYGFDFRDLAEWNKIGAPYTIYPKQTIRLKSSLQKMVKSKTLQPGPIVADTNVSKSKPNKVVKIETKVRKTKKAIVEKPKPKIKKTRLSSGKIKWQWPVKGKIVQSDLPTSKKGLDIGGLFGQEVKAAAAGDVVYSGSGLLGYGRLIIIKHNETYLSAYAHNSELMVSEGDEVTLGQKIAKMGKTSNGRALLHFEIRKNGQSVNPIGLLPKS